MVGSSRLHATNLSWHRDIDQFLAEPDEETTPNSAQNAFKRQGSTEVRMAHHNNTPNDHKDPNGAPRCLLLV